ncbi:hypothetical protein [Rhizobium croatiense]|uniref:hypothetical protein n=1 Tax=Rhizobium croatiense TaxID=2867516 RepID=UPI0023EB8E83|nr:hypothetical protein [Rhizobium croatiense]WET74123.1 hypothetical protein PYR68_00875 [Rhizobium croatiense]
MMNILPHETDGKFDLLIDTGRGAWIPMSKTSLDALLQKYDNAYPTYTEGTRQELIERWRYAEMIQLVERAAPVPSQSGTARRAA